MSDAELAKLWLKTKLKLGLFLALAVWDCIWLLSY